MTNNNFGMIMLQEQETIKKAEQEYHGTFVPFEKLKRKPDSFNIDTFELDGDIYEYTDKGFNGEFYKGWNTRTKEDYEIRFLSIILNEEKNEWKDLGIIVTRA